MSLRNLLKIKYPMMMDNLEDQIPPQIYIQKKIIRNKLDWNSEEEEILEYLTKRLQKDFQQISRYMNKTFQTNGFNTQKCKRRFELLENQINEGPLSTLEAQKLWILVKNQVLKAQFIWVVLEKQFINRSASRLENEFRKIFQFTLRRLNMFFGDPELQNKYTQRINQLQELTQYMIIFFSEQKLEQFSFNKHLYLIVQACHQLMPYIENFIKKGLLYKEDIYYYFDSRPFRNLPLLDRQQFDNLIERILLLESVNRIIFATQPYDYGEKVQKNAQNRSEKYASEKQKQNEGFVPLTFEQAQIIRNSELAQAILPFSLDQVYRKKNIM